MDEDEEGGLGGSRRATCGELQIMIDVNSEHLESLRSTCSSRLSSELTKREIRTLECKLIQLFGRQWATSSGCPSLSEVYPCLEQWLRVVGISKEARERLLSGRATGNWEALLEMQEMEGLLRYKEDRRRMTRALSNLRKYRESLLTPGGSVCGELYWDSWELPLPEEESVLSYSSSSSTSMIPSVLTKGNPGGAADSAASSLSSTTSGSIPPPSPGGHLLLSPPKGAPWEHHPDSALTKSISHDSELSNRLDELKPRRPRLSTEPVLPTPDEGIEPDPSPLASPRSPTADSNTHEPANSLQVPKSPRTPRSMGHVIRHRFKKTLKPAKCALCQEYMFSGLKCKECKYKCHRDCESNVPPSCGLPDPLVAYYMSHLSKEGSPILPRHSLPPPPIMTSSSNRFQIPGSGQGSSSACMNTSETSSGLSYPDSSSNTSSCNSSAPSSPAVILTTNPTTPHSASSLFRSHFRFPDPPLLEYQQTQQQHQTSGCNPPTTAVNSGIQYPAAASSSPSLQQQQSSGVVKVTSPNPVIDTVKSYDSDKTLSGASGSSGSGGTAYRLDSQDSTTSVDEAGSSNAWVTARQTSISMGEWDIAYEEVKIGDKIGSGRFSTVHQGNWHGDVAIKILNMENIDDEATLEAFRLDVATFRKTRHENLILFMGACMNPPKLAIVTSLCKGNTLYTHLHLRKDKFQINRLVQIAQQVAQGMGYLHHRGIIHKDLKTKNIFLERGKAVITDFGLVNVAGRLCARHVRPGSLDRKNAKQDYMSIPEGWLCYLAPEIMRKLRVQPDEGDLPFNKASDVYAFGTVWFELLTMEWPWKNQPPETIIWMVGRGMKPSLANLQASRDVKDILAMCWTYKQGDRPDFTELSNNLNLIPKKRSLIRSPSHPLHLSRSAESVF